MCKVDIFGFNAAVAFKIHRLSEIHLTLREFLHPKCYPCQQEFHLRADWDIHKFTADHLKVLAEKGITEVRM